MRSILIANLPPEVNNGSIVNVLQKYGEVKEIKDETWSKTYRYKIYNGIRMANMSLKTHIPSYVTIAGHRVLLSYEGQPATCYGCGQTSKTARLSA
jgi:hypothetical protein